MTMTTDAPAGLGARGQAVYDALVGADVVRNSLALEAARSADRLDELDEIIHGRGVLNLMQFRLDTDFDEDDGSRSVEVTVNFQNVLSEARQQQTVYATLLKALAVGAAPAQAAPGPAEQEQTGDDVLAAARARREARG